MPSTINLRRKIRANTNIKQITRAMQMVAASKMRRAQEAVTNTRAYASAGYEILTRLQEVLGRQATEVTHPLLEKREVKRITLVAIASDRGLAGGYNANVTRLALQFIKENKDKAVTVITVGRKVQDGLRRAGIEIAASFNDFPDRPNSTVISPIARLTIQAFLQNETDQVTVISTKFYSTLKQIAEAKTLIPFEQPDSQTSSKPVDFAFEPASTEVLNYIVPRMVEIQLLQSLLDAFASEHTSRMMAMKNATDNASELIDDLRLTYNSIRQANITQEIAEIGAGANT